MSAKAPEVVGQYVVYEMLGRGGMATVHRAEVQGIIRRPVALKRLHPYLTADADLVKSFVSEARLASHLRHTNCAQTYDLGKVDDTYFIAMEYVPGATVSQIVKQCNAAAGLMPIPIVLEILMQVLDGLDHAHNLVDESGKPLGLVHRDVSPSNIIVSNTGVVKLIDFGIAKAEGQGHRTQTGLIKGKFGYVAPEYTMGMLDARCDLFAVGVIAHELLTGRRLFEGKDNFEAIQMLREMPIAPPSRVRPEVAHDLDDIVLTALQREPRQRWQSAAAMRVALGNFARDAKLEITNQQLKDWVEWAFTKESFRGDNTQLARAIQTLGEPSTGSAQLTVEQRDQLDDDAKTMIRPSVQFAAVTPDATEAATHAMSKLKAQYPTTKIEHSQKWGWLFVLLVVLAGAAVITVDELGYEFDTSVFG